jgi:hypothetical protein
VNIDWAVTCRYAESDGAVATLVGAGIDAVFLPTFPGPVGVMMAVRLAAPPEELAPGQIHTLRCRILDAAGDPVTALDRTPTEPLEIAIGSQVPIQQLVPGWLVQPLVAMGVQWLASEPQTYRIELRIDDSEHLSPFHVVAPPR